MIRLETVLELALHRSSGASGLLLEADGHPHTPPPAWFTGQLAMPILIERMTA